MDEHCEQRRGCRCVCSASLACGMRQTKSVVIQTEFKNVTTSTPYSTGVLETSPWSAPYGDMYITT